MGNRDPLNCEIKVNKNKEGRYISHMVVTERNMACNHFLVAGSALWVILSIWEQQMKPKTHFLSQLGLD